MDAKEKEHRRLQRIWATGRKYEGWLFDLEHDDPNRCLLRDHLLDSRWNPPPPTWRCHKQVGHDGACSTHVDCGHRNKDWGVCAFAPGHSGPHMGQRPIEPMSDRLKEKILRRTGQIGMCYTDNRMAYNWRMFERKHPVVARLAFLVRFGPQVALGKAPELAKKE